ncbi:MAG: manganese efflux pump [Treponema sp.]|nr:manganese efflux pump [Treponema sp.]
MNFLILFVTNSILLGIGLAMDAFSVSIANALNEPEMKITRMSLIAGCYAFFQFIMPVAGWVCVHTIAQIFTSFQKFIPWIALILLLYIGGKMLWESFHNEESDDSSEIKKLTFVLLIVQGIATSIDALSVGFTIADYNFSSALAASIIIAAVTFAICITGLKIGKTVGTRLSGKAEILGGLILIGIGIEIFVRDVFFAS